ncbi:hypothetical protein N7520_000194 [Penicillium odoratum]|uniref:uncharacterized protein n=1 Tax=Penicillium odoratum TaxID=1167516 RepID=UPI0025484D55|nr:uncharacterized protein N7520_000194 [Penicillium odoratum]KAJ5776948.1 hypothetical protein N7520_000194 [Penicillium odoratum]
MFGKLVLSVGVLLAGVQAQQAGNCLKKTSAYVSDVMLKQSILTLNTILAYTPAQLIAAVNDTVSIPQLSVTQLSQTLFHCTDILGGITGNAFCFAGCDTKPSVRNDQCIM